MRNRILLALAAVCALALFISPAARADDAPSLKIGDPAPQLYVSQWLNGDPVTKFESGKIYVVECWATWCGPCVASIPHVTEMQHKYGDKGVKIIGLNVWDGDVDKVKALLKAKGKEMDYVVAIDEGGQHGKSAAAWLAAAGQNGIPCSFIVDREGKIAWIGHPMAMEPVLKQVVAGTYDAKKQAAEDAKLDNLQNDLNAAAQAGDWDKFLKIIDQLEAVKPEMKQRGEYIRFNVLLNRKHDTDAAYKLAEHLLTDEMKDEPEGLAAVAGTILEAPGVEPRNIPLAAKIANRANELTKGENPIVLHTVAAAQFKQGQVDDAIKTEKAAVDHATDNPRMKAAFEKSLGEYEAAKQAGTKPADAGAASK